MTTRAIMLKQKKSNTNNGSVNRTKSVIQSLIRFIISLVFLLALWQIFSIFKGSPMLFPGPQEVYKAFLKLLKNGEIFGLIGISLFRILSGLIIGSISGVALGLLLGSSKIISGLLSPLMTLFRFVPPLAWYAPVLAWLGTGEGSKIVLIVYTTIFVVAINTISGMSEIPLNASRMLSMAGANWLDKFISLSLPFTLPYSVTGIRLAMGNAFMTVVTAEMLGAQSGLGVLIMKSMTTINLANVFVAIFILGVLGLIADKAFTYYTNKYLKKFLPWTR